MRNIILLSGGPGLYDPLDLKHDSSWANYVTAPLKKGGFQARDEEVWWFIYKPAYERRWNQDKSRRNRQHEVNRVRGKSCGTRKCRSYMDLLEARARSRGWKLQWITSANEFWRFMKGFKDPIARFYYWGHARNDLWLSIRRDASHIAIAPPEHEIIRVADIARHGALRSSFVRNRSSSRHAFYGCNTHTFARAWSRTFRLYTRGFEGIVDFRSVSAQGVPSRSAGCETRDYNPSTSTSSPRRLAPADVTAFVEQFTPDNLYRGFVYGNGFSKAMDLQRHFRVLAGPGDRLQEEPLPGDVLVTVALGEPGLGQATILNDALPVGITDSSSTESVYPHRTVFRDGKLPAGTLLLRLNTPEVALRATEQASERRPLQPPPPLQTLCGFSAQRGMVSEVRLRAAVSNTAVAQRRHWLTAGGRIVGEGDNARFGRLVGYWLAQHSQIRPTTLTAIQGRAVDPAVNYGRLLDRHVAAGVLNRELRRVAGELLRGAPDAGRPANLNALVRGALSSTRDSRIDHETRGPWSAVFVCACIREAAAQEGIEAFNAGVHSGQDALLRATIAHRVYILEAYRRRHGPNPRKGTYHAFAPHERAPQLGDIIVQDRRGRIRPNQALRYDEIPGRLPGGFPTHGDIVVSIAPDRSHVVTIGGNVGDSVRRRRFPLDANGRLVVDAARRYTQEDDNGRLPDFPRPRRRQRLDSQSTGRIFALLSPEMECIAIPGQRVPGGVLV